MATQKGRIPTKISLMGTFSAMPQRLKREAGLLAHLDQVPDLLGRLVGLDLDLGFEPEGPAAQCPGERRALHEEAGNLSEPDRLDAEPRDSPEPESCVSIQNAIAALK